MPTHPPLTPQSTATASGQQLQRVFLQSGTVLDTAVGWAVGWLPTTAASVSYFQDWPTRVSSSTCKSPQTPGFLTSWHF